MFELSHVLAVTSCGASGVTPVDDTLASGGGSPAPDDVAPVPDDDSASLYDTFRSLMRTLEALMMTLRLLALTCPPPGY